VKKAVGYLRVSSQEQADSGLSLEQQERDIRAAARRAGLELVAIFADEGKSGGLPAEDRDGFAEALAELPRQGALVVQKRDRLGREMYELALAERAAKGRKATILSATEPNTHGDPDNPGVFLMKAMTDVIAHYERLMGKVRMKAAARAKKARGEPAGFVGFGYRVNDQGKLEEDPAEQDVIEVVLHLRGRGYTHRSIVRELGERGIVSPRCGNPLGLSQVQRILKKQEG
jgi:DNA invertase Pin-like site-specific DNA recombinase